MLQQNKAQSSLFCESKKQTDSSYQEPEVVRFTITVRRDCVDTNLFTDADGADHVRFVS